MNTQLYLDQEPTSDGSTLIVRALLRLTADAPPDEKRRPLNLSLVLDRSGSMSGPKLHAAKQAAAALARRLGPKDILSVVDYGSDVATAAEPGTSEEQPDLIARIEAIECDGMTNLSGGWLRGRELVARNVADDRVSRVILLTDGLANEGVTDGDRLAELCRGAAADGITTTTVGFGEGFNEHLLTLMADAGGGGTYYIEEPDQAVAVFGAELEGLLTVAAQNTAVEIRPAAAVELAAVHHTYPRRPIDGGLRLELGDLYAREPKALLAQFLVPAGSVTGDVAIADVTVHAHVLGDDGSIERREVRLPITVDASGQARVDAEVRRELLRLEAATARREALDRANRGDTPGAELRLRETAQEIRASEFREDALLEEAADLELLAERFEQAGELSDMDRKYMHTRAYAAERSRPFVAEPIARTRPRK